MSYLEKFKSKYSNTNPGTKEDSQGVTWEQLFKEVGAKIVYENKKPVLRFNPPLDGPKVDPERWQKALKLEEYFNENFIGR